MIELYSNNVVALADTAIPLESVSIKKGCSVINSGTRSIQFNKAGIYNIEVNASMLSTTATSGELSIQIMQNGVLAPDAVSSETVTNTTGVHALGFSKLIQVPNDNNNCCCKTAPTIVNIINAGVDATIENINVVITKIC